MHQGEKSGVNPAVSSRTTRGECPNHPTTSIWRQLDRRLPAAGLVAQRRDGIEIAPKRIGATARALDLKDVDALCLLATDMHTFGIIDALEQDLGLPVLSSNQALLWAGLRALGVGDPVEGVGQLLRRPR